MVAGRIQPRESPVGGGVDVRVVVNRRLLRVNRLTPYTMFLPKSRAGGLVIGSELLFETRRGGVGPQGHRKKNPIFFSKHFFFPGL